ncbi:MAG TPA: hypothetical protein VK206_13640 [Anaerolineales bacterium]|nr:hypothetical protein [Anaerolineales bacterium]
MFLNRVSKIVAVLLVLAAVFLSTSFSTRAANISRVKSSYDNIELVRSEQTFSPRADRSYDAIEFARNKQPVCDTASTCTADGCTYTLSNGFWVH